MQEVARARFVAVLAAFTLTLSTGCVSMFKRMVHPGDFGSEVEAISELQSLSVARCEREVADDVPERVAKLNESLPGELGDSVLFERMSSVYGQVLESRSGSSDNVSARDVEQFADSFAEAMSASGQLSAEAQQDVWATFREYYKAYIKGEFVDRTGAKLSRPEIKKSVGNGTLSAALQVLLEAASDQVLQTPVVYHLKAGKEIYFPHETEAIPTAVEVMPGLKRKVVGNESACGVSEKEAKAIGYAAALAGDRSSIVSGMVLESFGDVQLAFGVGGHFSVGDNETLATLVKTFFEVVSRRGTERLFYDFFDEYRVPLPAERAADAQALADGQPSLLSDQDRVDVFLSGF